MGGVGSSGSHHWKMKTRGQQRWKIKNNGILRKQIDLRDVLLRLGLLLALFALAH